jgi:hypothetical protein
MRLLLDTHVLAVARHRAGAIAQAQLEGLPIMTADATFAAYEVERIAC